MSSSSCSNYARPPQRRSPRPAQVVSLPMQRTSPRRSPGVCAGPTSLWLRLLLCVAAPTVGAAACMDTLMDGRCSSMTTLLCNTAMAAVQEGCCACGAYAEKDGATVDGGVTKLCKQGQGDNGMPCPVDNSGGPCPKGCHAITVRSCLLVHTHSNCGQCWIIVVRSWGTRLSCGTRPVGPDLRLTARRRAIATMPVSESVTMTMSLSSAILRNNHNNIMSNKVNPRPIKTRSDRLPPYPIE